MAESVTVLHVDDESEFVDMAATFLERTDPRFEVITETSARDGLDTLADTDVDCIVSDYDMPEMDGLEFLEVVRDTNPDLPFILFTGMGSEAVASEAISAGVTDYLQKSGATGQYELLANRIENAVAQYEAERRATEIDRRLRELTEATDDVFWMFDADWSELLFVNSAYEDVWGQSVEALEADARSFLEGIHPDDRDRVREAMATLSGGEPVEIEYRVDEREDYGRWVWVEGVPLTDEEGTVERVAGFVRDVSDRKAREAELELRTRAMEAAPVGITITDPDQPENPVIYANEAFQALTGYDESEILGRNCRFLQGEATDPEAVATLREAIDAEEPVSVDILNYRADDTPFWNRVTVAPVHDDGEVTHFVGFQRDVTDRKEQEDTLREQKAKIEALHDVATTISTCESRQAVYEELVAAAREILEYDIVIVDEAQGDVLVPMAESSHLDREQYYEETPIYAEDNLAATAYRTGEPSVVEDLTTLDVTPADPEFRSALTVPIGDIGVFQTVARSAGAYDDADLELVELLVAHARETLARLSEEEELRARTRELERKNDRLDEFASLVSHDLRNPLNLAQGHLDLALETCDNEHLETVASAHDRMDQLIEDILDLTRHGGTVTDPEPVDVPEIVMRCWASIDPAGASLSVTVPDDFRVAADEGRFQQLLENLFRNAVEHGGETVTIGELPDGFYVEDDGPGIQPTDRDKVFEYGYSTESSGSGLGLAIVGEIADAHGWSVSVTTGEAGGARFEFRDVTVDP
ncbi:MAG: PAS domain S-box protein [Halobacteriaceae archaeon]